jgi:hypothetical protein
VVVSPNHTSSTAYASMISINTTNHEVFTVAKRQLGRSDVELADIDTTGTVCP